MRSLVQPSDSAALEAAKRSVKSLGKLGKRPLSFYQTNELAVHELRKRVEISGVLYEPCNGLGAISRMFPDCCVVTNDVDPDKPADRHEDAAGLVLDTIAFDGVGSCWVVTNPPFGAEAFPIVRNFVEQGALCAFLLLVSFLEPTFERGDWLEANAHRITGKIVLPRHSFTHDGKTYSQTCEWLLWNTPRLEPFVQVVSKGPKP